MRKKQFRAVEFVSRVAELKFSFFLVFTHFCVELFSGQDEVRTSNLLHLSVGLSAIRPHALTTQPSRQLKVH